MNKRASTSKPGELRSVRYERSIIEQLSKMKIISTSLKKMKSTKSVSFILSGKVTAVQVCNFYLSQKELDIPDTEESERIAKRITANLDYVDAADLLNIIKIQLSVAKKEIDSIVKDMRILLPKYDALVEEVKKLDTRMKSVDSKYCELLDSYELSLRELKRQGDTSLALGKICQEYTGHRDELTERDEATHAKCANRSLLIQKAMETAQKALEDLNTIYESFKERDRDDNVKLKTFPNDTPDVISGNIEELKGYTKKFELKMKTSDEKGKLILKAFRTYAADVKLLINYYTDTNKAYNASMKELIDLHLKLNSSVVSTDLLKKRGINLIAKFDQHEKRIVELGSIIRESQQSITQNSIRVEGAPNKRTLLI